MTDRRPRGLFGRLFRNRRGAVAMIVAGSMPVLVAATALTIDISHYRYVQNRLQSAADAAALAAVGKIDTPTTAVTDAVAYASRNVPSNFGTVATAGDVQLGTWDPVAKTFTPGGGASINAVRVVTGRTAQRGNEVPTILLHYFGSTAPAVQASATAARHLIVQYEPPEKTDLDNEAWDFNRLYAYCYRYTGTGAASTRRSQMTLIADNVPKSGSGVSNFWTEAGRRGFNRVPTNFIWPECAKGESLSFRLQNVREVKQNIASTSNTRTYWQNFDRNRASMEFNHYTDTTIAAGVETFGGLTESILETVRCDSADLCDPSKSGNVIPSGRNRAPQVSGLPCMPGKFMYFGWEDRPPTNGDRDYDDIRILMRCPKTGVLGDGMSRLVG